MSEEIAKIDFDIALIACGAYGFPLASRIKNMGKIAIHCGGPLTSPTYPEPTIVIFIFSPTNNTHFQYFDCF